MQGSDLQLTLDSDLQYTVQQRARRLRGQRTGAKPAASAVVLDAHTAEVLAMANGSTFDPRDLATATPGQLGNPAVQSPFEPGSVNKVVTMAAALEYGAGRARTTCCTVPGQHPGRRPDGQRRLGPRRWTATRSPACWPSRRTSARS